MNGPPKDFIRIKKKTHPRKSMASIEGVKNFAQSTGQVQNSASLRPGLSGLGARQPRLPCFGGGCSAG